ncbi:hypothetical protein [Moorena sp. SIO3H5]|uniref:hypothetical protein n=1 Tax=Moorena sp. SIO3H5 TaxID=2607834 RepID=UPI0013B72D2F|nr:hypothetical protein [Moorena sp. SIO3H5]NEO72499.1 hypothetical protein [Moorena sp. SIO3H5]
MPTPLLFIQRFSNAWLVQGTRKEFHAIAKSDRKQNPSSPIPGVTKFCVALQD